MNGKPVFLNLGCGFRKSKQMVNVDAFDICEPDVVHDLNVFPYPWKENSVDGIIMWHVLEHLDDWWGAFCECARISKPGSTMEIRVPDESSGTALTYRDHNHVFSVHSFHGIQDRSGYGTNAWAMIEDNIIPLEMLHYQKIPCGEYNWMMRWPFRWLLGFCANHLRNFIHEQKFLFRKIGEENE